MENILMANTEKSPQVSIVVFIDALGWEVLKNRQFLQEELPHRRKLRSVFGFSSACVPSILTGLMPREHKHWSFFYHSPEASPFKALRMLRILPASLSDRGRFRSLLSKLIKKLYGYTGYFQLYNMPFRLINQFDYCEKRDLFAADGINNGENIFEVLDKAGVAFHRSDWRLSEEENLESARQAVTKGDVPFAFLYMAAMDALLHQVGKDSDKVDKKLAWYEVQLRELMALAQNHYQDVRIFVCSDHGMCTVEHNVDLMAAIKDLGLEETTDYVATYDSTMARFWFKNEAARQRISAALNSIPEGRILSSEELTELGCDFEGDQYGELIYLLNPGTLIVPSHMGTQTITGMHGYHPDHPDSDASLLSNVAPDTDPQAINDMFTLMRSEALAAEAC
jgi:hypothetical protein